MEIFTKKRALTPSWDLVAPSFQLLKQNLWQVVYLSFVPGLLLSVGLVMTNEGQLTTLGSREVMGLWVLGGAGLYSLLAYPGYRYMQAQAVQGNEVTAWEAYRYGLSRLFPLIGMGIVSGFLIVLGLIAFIIPGLILLRGFYLSSYYLVDQNLGPIESLKRSFQDSRPVTGWIWGIIGVSFVFSMVGSLFGRIEVVGPIISLMVTYPYAFGSALRYGEITKRGKPVAQLASKDAADA